MRHPLLLFFLFSNLSVFCETALKKYFTEENFTGHYHGMKYFHQQILPLDSNEAMERLNTLQQREGAAEKAITSAWKGLYLHNKHSSELHASIQYLEDAFELASKKNLAYWRSIFANHLGFLYLLDKNYHEGVEFLLLSDQLLTASGYSNFYEADLYLYHIARMYFEFIKHEKCIEYLEKALEFAEENSKTRQLSLNLLGISNAELENYGAASYYLELTKEKVLSNKDSSGIAALNGNLGILYSYQESYEKAKPLLWDAYHYNTEKKNWKSLITNLIWLAEVSLNQNHLDSAETFLKSAHQIIQKNNIESMETWGLYYRTGSNFHNRTGNYEKAYDFLDSAHYLENKINKLRDATLLSDVNFKLISDKHYYELELLERQKEHEAFIRNLIIAFSLLACMFLLYITYLSYRNRKKEKVLFMEEQEKTLSELESFRNRIKSKNKMLENVKDQLNKMKIQNNEEEKVKTKMAQDLSQSVILTEEDWQKFKSLFEKVHPDFLRKVQTEFPDLTTAEIRLLALLKLDLSVSEMANTLAILPESVRKTRQRLMKKLEISYHKELRNFIKEL